MAWEFCNCYCFWSWVLLCGHERAADSGRFGESSLSNKLDFCYLRPGECLGSLGSQFVTLDRLWQFIDKVKSIRKLFEIVTIITFAGNNYYLLPLFMQLANQNFTVAVSRHNNKCVWV